MRTGARIELGQDMRHEMKEEMRRISGGELVTAVYQDGDAQIGHGGT